MRIGELKPVRTFLPQVGGWGCVACGGVLSARDLSLPGKMPLCLERAFVCGWPEDLVDGNGASRHVWGRGWL